MNIKHALIIIFSFTFFFFAAYAHAANLNLSPTAGSYAEGKTFSVAVSVASPSQSINAVSGTINFPADKLQVVSVSKAGSIVSFWSPGFPSSSNAAGTVSFEGVIFNPGYTGANGKIITITFKTKVGSGEANVTFARGSVLANDGQGTEVISALGRAVYLLTPLVAQPVTEAQPVVIEEEEIFPESEVQVIEVPQAVVPVASPEIIQPTSRYETTTVVIFFGCIIFLLLILLLYLGRKYHILRRAVGEAFHEEQRQRNKVIQFLNADIKKRGVLVRKLKLNRKLTPEEQDIIAQIEKEYQDK